MGSYIPSSIKERAAMLEAIGMKEAKELFHDVPKEMLLEKPLDLPTGLSEMETRGVMMAMAEKNTVFKTVLRGAGAYDHYIPSIVKYIPAKEDFLTAYTPYQAEISQGVLQSIFEFQSMVCELTGLDAANASLYDGQSAAAEACRMVCERKRTVTLVSAAAHPDTIATIKTYAWGANAEVGIIPEKNGVTDMEALKAMLKDTVAGVYLQSPNFYGNIELVKIAADAAHAAGAKLIMGTNPIALALYLTPAELDADIAVGEGQPLGMPLAFGGPYLGYMAVKTALLRKMPGRIVGETTDVDGKRAFVLTLQAREQHIRREKAGSNICSNQALCALTAACYMAAMGPKGMREAAEQSRDKAHYFAGALEKQGFKRAEKAPFFHEFATSCPIAYEKVEKALEKKGILGGLMLKDGRVLWCVTEKVSRQALDSAVEAIKEAVK